MIGKLAGFGTLGEGVQVFDPHLSIFLAEQNIHIGDHSRIDGGVRIEGGEGVYIGANVHIASGCKIIGGGYFQIGSHSGLSDDVVIATGMPDLDFVHISAAEPEEHLHPLRAQVIIGQHVCIFAGARILPGIRIDDFAVVGMGAVVTKNVPACAYVWGNPAKVRRMRGDLR